MIDNLFAVANLGDAIFWAGLWLYIMLVTWIAHKKFMAGYDNLFFGWRTPQDKLIRNAILAEAQLDILENAHIIDNIVQIEKEEK